MRKEWRGGGGVVCDATAGAPARHLLSRLANLKGFALSELLLL